MNNAIQTFNNPEFGEVRVLEIEGEPWLVGKDVAEKLGYADSFGALKKHVDDEDKQNCQNDSFDSPRGMTIINESGLYALVLGSKLPTAKKFKRWVTSEVLPSIRKTGMYSTIRPPQSDASSAKRAEASLLNAKARAAKLLYEIASNSSNELYRQAGEAIAMNMLAGQKVIDMPEAEQRPNHELGYFCQFIGKAATWASTLGKKLKAAGADRRWKMHAA